MSEQDKPFVINDRRKFRMDGEPVAPNETPATETPRAEAAAGPVAVPTPIREEAPAVGAPIPFQGSDAADAETAEEAAAEAATSDEEAPKLPPPPTPEEIEQVRLAYEETAERLDTMMRSQNLGAEHLPPMDFTQLVQSIYMSAMMQLGAGTQQGQQARVDIIGAKQSIDMLNVVAEKAGSNLTDQETRLIEAALFELRMGFLEITQLLARQAQAKATQQPPVPGTPGASPFGGGGFTGGGPRIVK